MSTCEIVPFDVSVSEEKTRDIIGNLLQYANNIVVRDELSFKKITEIYRQARDLKKAIETKRKELVDPIRKELNIINDQAKELTGPLDEIVSIANFKTNSYQKILLDLKQIEDDELRKAASLFDAEDSLYIAPLDKTIRGNGAMAINKTSVKFTVKDISQVPHKYLCVDSEVLQEDISLGLRNIPGIEIYEETTTTLRIR